MKTVKILGDTLNKVADTSTVFNFRLWNEGQAQDVTGKAVSFVIANDSGYLFDVPAVVDGNVISLDFSNELLKQLTPDTYHMEVSVTNKNGDVELYPSEGAIDFTVGKNLHGTQGKLVPQITFDTVLASVDKKIAEYTKTITKGDKGDTGPQGPQGPQGPKGDTGPQGPKGDMDLSQIKVGGRNLIVRTGELAGYIVGSTGNIDSLSGSATMQNPITVKPGDQLTMSGTAAGSETLFRYGFYDASGNLVMRAFVQVTNVTTVTAPTGSSTFRISYPQSAQVKLERGNIATDWTPAPEDVDSTYLKKTNQLPTEALDFNYLATHMQTYQGTWWSGANPVLNGPIDNFTWSSIEIVAGNSETSGRIIATKLTTNDVYLANVDRGVLKEWKLIPNDANVVHKTGTGTIAGDKTFVGNTTLATTTILAGNYGLRVTSSGFQKTTDGKTWVAANI